MLHQKPPQPPQPLPPPSPAAAAAAPLKSPGNNRLIKGRQASGLNTLAMKVPSADKPISRSFPKLYGGDSVGGWHRSQEAVTSRVWWTMITLCAVTHRSQNISIGTQSQHHGVHRRWLGFWITSFVCLIFPPLLCVVCCHIQSINNAVCSAD